jgi:allantoate deiminase
MHLARTVMQRAAALARISEHPQYLLRRSYTEAMREANAAVVGWMEQAGMTVHLDHTGNLVGRYGIDDPAAPTLIFGSHLDSVRNAGAYDGPLGVLLALAAVEHIRLRGEWLPFRIEVVCFADEEGLRWGTAYLGSKAIAGTFDAAYLDRVDADGTTLAAALRAFGGSPERIGGDRRDRSRILGYCEAHIEQGPVLEAHDLPVGIVTAIAGQSRFALAFTGTAGHAGTVPMTLRHDALCAAAEFVLAVETYARTTPGLVATVGQLAVQPGASNVIPGQVSLTLDLRHADDAVRLEACHSLHDRMESIATERAMGCTWETVQETGAVTCDIRLAELLARAVEHSGHDPFHLPSGAGHDAVAMADLTPVTMLFVRCAAGISHNPAESVEERDVAVAIDVLARFILLLATTDASAVTEKGTTL